MSKTIRGHNLRATVVMALLAVLLLALVIAVQPAATTSDLDGNPAIHPMSGTGGSNFTHDPYINQHGPV